MRMVTVIVEAVMLVAMVAVLAAMPVGPWILMMVSLGGGYR